MKRKIDIQIPSKLMLIGEYCVLWEKTCISMALSKFMQITVELNSSKVDALSSDIWQDTFYISQGEPTPFSLQNHFLPALITELKKFLNIENGINFKVQSGWPINYGIGSSSALILGTCIALNALASESPVTIMSKENWELARYARHFQNQLQGFSSGYDIATQLTGGLIEFSYNAFEWPKTCQHLNADHVPLKKFIHIFVGGLGAPTKTVGQSTLEWITRNKLKDELINATQRAIDIFKEFLSEPTCDKKFSLLIKAVSSHRKIFENGPFFPKKVKNLLDRCSGLDKTFSYKTTGAGGEDALIIFAKPMDLIEPERLLATMKWQKLSVDFPSYGLSIK